MRHTPHGRWHIMSAVLLAVLVAVAVAPSARAQKFPDAPVRLIVPIAPGGVTAPLRAVIAPGLSQGWGQPVIVDNRPGGDTAVGALAVERSAPDGYTLLTASDATFTANPHLSDKLPYRPKNFTPIAMLASITPMLIVSS